MKKRLVVGPTAAKATRSRLQITSMGNIVLYGLECVDRFCYLLNMIEAGGGAEEASRARVRCVWAKLVQEVGSNLYLQTCIILSERQNLDKIF